MKDPEIFKTTGLTPRISGGDGKQSHKLIFRDNNLILMPRWDAETVKYILYSLSGICVIAAIYTLTHGEALSSVFLGSFAWGFFTFGKNGKGQGITTIDMNSREATYQNNKEKTTLQFDEISCLEIITKLKSAGNNNISRTNELNISLQKGNGFNIATGNDDIILYQARTLALSIQCSIKYDDELKYR